MSSDKFFSRGIECLSSAVSAEQEQDFDEALKLYIRSFEFLFTGLKYCKNEKVKNLVRTQVKEFMTRAEAVKAAVAKNKHNVTEKQNMRPDTNKIAHPSAEKKKGAGKHEREPDQVLRRALESTILTDKPNLSWNDVAGLPEAKQALQEAVQLPQKFPQLFTGERKPWKGILLYGPPGTGKSHIAKVIASIGNATFFSVSSSDLVSKYFGESEKLIRELFLLASQSKPAIIFIDEIDAICGKREHGDEATNRMKNEFLTCMQDVLDSDGVLVLAATNRPFDLDSAVRRRFEKRIYIALPDEPGRNKLLELNLGEEAKNFNEEDFKEIVAQTDGFSGSDIASLCRDVLMQPVRECVKAKWWRRDESGRVRPCEQNDASAFRADMMQLPGEAVALPDIQMSHFDKSLEKAKSSVNPEELAVFDQFTAMFGTVQQDQEREKMELEEQENNAEGNEKENNDEKEKEKEEPKNKKPRTMQKHRPPKSGKGAPSALAG